MGGIKSTIGCGAGNQDNCRSILSNRRNKIIYFIRIIDYLQQFLLYNIIRGEENVEIERKWLIKTEKIPFDLASCSRIHIDQAYVSFSPTIRIRDVDHGRKYLLTVKTKAAGFDPDLAKNEYETEISAEEYGQLMQIARGNIVSKTRYIYNGDNGYRYEIDIFEGLLKGLAYLEIEFDDNDAATGFPDPEWVECDVTYLSDYKNSSLAKYGIPEQKNEKGEK